MNFIKKIFFLTILSSFISIVFSYSVKASTIDNINLNIDYSDISVTSKEKFVSVISNNEDMYYIPDNVGSSTNMPISGWKANSTPRFNIYIKANDGYKFDISKIRLSNYYEFNNSNIKFLNAGGNSDSIKLNISLPTLYDSFTITDLNISNIIWDIEDAKLYWDSNIFIKKYYLELYKDNQLIYKASTTNNEYDFASHIKSVADYYVIIRGFDGKHHGDNFLSNNIHIDKNILNDIKGKSYYIDTQNGPGVNIINDISKNGTWIKDSKGWWLLNNDRTYPISNWKFINNKWYYFDENGYMKTGWIYWKNNWYYCGQDGDMYVSRMTPDGYYVDKDGVWRP